MELKTDKLWEEIVAYLIATPKVLGAFCAAYFSGHLWVFIIFGFFIKKKSVKNLVDKFWGKVSLGIIWLGFVSAPVYYLRYNTLIVSYDDYLNILYTTVLFSFFIQFIIMAAFTCLKEAV
ncbi:hypothetical protein [Enterobacter cloacae]|uniref:hypothetical protein n=1 Tax=Enterobacter cloacae TaxID=550 RepID=UPI000B07FDCB